MVPVKFGVVERISFALEGISEITIGHEQWRWDRSSWRSTTCVFQESRLEGEAQRQTRACRELVCQPFPVLILVRLPPERTGLGKDVAENLWMLESNESGRQSTQAYAADDCLLRTVGGVVVNASPGNDLLGQKV